jgi:hypothetical protein
VTVPPSTLHPRVLSPRHTVEAPQARHLLARGATRRARAELTAGRGRGLRRAPLSIDSVGPPSDQVGGAKSAAPAGSNLMAGHAVFGTLCAKARPWSRSWRLRLGAVAPGAVHGGGAALLAVGCLVADAFAAGCRRPSAPRSFLQARRSQPGLRRALEQACGPRASRARGRLESGGWETGRRRAARPSEPRSTAA